jgi:hypothetical protein
MPTWILGDLHVGMDYGGTDLYVKGVSYLKGGIVVQPDGSSAPFASPFASSFCSTDGSHGMLMQSDGYSYWGGVAYNTTSGATVLFAGGNDFAEPLDSNVAAIFRGDVVFQDLSANRLGRFDTATGKFTAGAIAKTGGTSSQFLKADGGTDSTAYTPVGLALKTNYQEKTANYTVNSVDNTINCTSGTFTVTLPTSVGIAGRFYNIKNSGVGVITVATTSSQTIDGVTTKTLAATKGITVQSTGANWIIISDV